MVGWGASTADISEMAFIIGFWGDFGYPAEELRDGDCCWFFGGLWDIQSRSFEIFSMEFCMRFVL